MKNSVTIEVTKKHFDLANAALTKGRSVLSTCLLAQAIKAAFPKKTVNVFLSTATVGKQEFTLPTKAQKLISRFDNCDFYGELSKAEKAQAKKLRASLPVTFTMTEA